ncbi:MAG: preprotein translocase subunit SecE [Candidatus Omnitrophota bacterium]|nr:preprotein translocase subunit SecE [Candidatus Omnitrophota bacterium]MBU1895054.1 preprotein translocase subunit SecE [Candidatus Omnitrophota bacterium]
MVKIGKFISQVKTEMQKVAWPSRPELIGSTVIVLVSTLLLSLYIGVCDMFFSRFVNLLVSGVFK